MSTPIYDSLVPSSSKFPVTTSDYINHNGYKMSDIIGDGMVTPEMYGAVGDGTTDDSDALQAMFDDIKSGVICFGNNRTYATSKELVVHAGYVSLTILLGCIKYIGVESDTNALIKISRDVHTQTGNGNGGVKFFGGSLDCNKLAGCGIRNADAYHTVIDSVKISYYRTVGIDVGDDSVTSTLSTQVMISNCYINNHSYEDRGTAIRLVHTDNNVSNCVTNGSDVGIELKSGGNYISNTHFTCSAAGVHSESDLQYMTHKFIVNNPLNTSSVQLNSFSNCYFNGSRTKYIIYNTSNNSLITALDSCSVIMGSSDITQTSYLMNSNYSAIQISNIKVRKSSVHTIIGLVKFTGAAGVLQKSSISVDNTALKNQNDGDINNMDTSSSSVISSGSMALPAHTLRRIATIYEPSNLPSGATLEMIIDGKTRININTSINNSSIEYVSGIPYDQIKIYKDSASSVKEIGNEFSLRCYDLYILNDTEEDFDTLTILEYDNSNYPFSQVAIYRGNSKDTLNPNLTNLKEISEIDDGSIHDNLIPYPYKSESGTRYGVECTENDDGSITLNGTCNSANVLFRIIYNTNPLTLERCKYIYTAGIKRNDFVAGCRTNVTLVKSDDTTETKYVGYTPLLIDNTNGDYKEISYISFMGAKDAVLNNYTAYPMVLKGEVLHKYTPCKLSRETLRKEIDALKALASS